MMSENADSEGRRLLRKYLDDRAITTWRFCKDHGFNHVTIQRLLRGERGGEITASFAFRLEEATGGVVPAKSWTIDPDPVEPIAVPHAPTGTH